MNSDVATCRECGSVWVIMVADWNAEPATYAYRCQTCGYTTPARHEKALADSFVDWQPSSEVNLR